MDNKSGDSDKNSVARSTYYTASTIVAMVMAIPGVIALLVVRHYTTDIATQIIVSSIVFFAGIGFSFRVAKKLARKMDKRQSGRNKP